MTTEAHGEDGTWQQGQRRGDEAASPGVPRTDGRTASSGGGRRRRRSLSWRLRRRDGPADAVTWDVQDPEAGEDISVFLGATRLARGASLQQPACDASTKGTSVLF